MDIEIRYLDNHLLVVNKPAGMPSQEDASRDLDVVTWGKEYLKKKFDKPGRVYLGLVHRLDRPASGVMVLARTSKAAARLSDQFRKRTASRRYVGIVEGHVEKDRSVLTDYLLKQDRHVRVVEKSHSGAKWAELSYEVARRSIWRRQNVSLVEVALNTGRAHQIRVQLGSRGHPILGDLRYEAKTEFDGRNLALHAFSLTLTHPTRRETMRFKAHPSRDWEVFSDDLARIISAP